MNEAVMRYELFAGVRNAPDHGTFVEYKDYAEAVAELATLRAQLAGVRELSKRAREIWRDETAEPQTVGLMLIRDIAALDGAT